MVVASNDLAPLAGGFTDDASEVIPTSEDGLIPEDDDTAVLSDLDGDDAAASDVADDEAEETDPTLALRQQVEAQLRGQIEAEFEERRLKYQSTKDREVAQARNAFDELRTFNQSIVEAYIERLSEAGLSEPEIERELDALQGRTQRRVQQAAQSTRQSEEQFMGWAQSSIQRMKAYVERQSLHDDGQTRLFDPAQDAELQRLALDMYQNARLYSQTGDEQYRVRNTQAYEAHRARVQQLREAGLKRVLTEQRKRNAEPQRKARAIQAERGRQVAVTGAGAAPPNADDRMRQAEAIAQERGIDLVREYDKVHRIYLSLKHSTPQ